MSEFTAEDEVQRLAAKYSSFFKLLEQLSDREVEDVYWVMKRKIEEPFIINFTKSWHCER